MIPAIVWSLLVQPVFWLTKTIVVQFSIILALTIAYRFYRTVLVRVAPANWAWPLVGDKLKPIQANQAILITGATSGIGLALAKHLYRAGYSVLAAYYDSSEAGYSELRQLAGQLANGKQKLFLLELDVRDEQSIGRSYEQCSKLMEEHELELYALINNAGLGFLQPFAWFQRKSIRNLIETNLIGNLQMSREYLPLLIKSRGRLLFVSSGLGFVPGPAYATYGITKSAQIYLARCLNVELKKRYGVHSIAIMPHNFIKNTNICSLNAKNNELAWQELKPIEREFYKEQFDHYCELAKSLDEVTKGSNQRIQQKSSTSATSTSGNKLQNLANKIISIYTDPLSTKADTLEQSGILETFEDALRLENPPELLFAGDTLFQLLAGSILLSLPNSCMGLLSAMIAKSLYK